MFQVLPVLLLILLSAEPIERQFFVVSGLVSILEGWTLESFTMRRMLVVFVRVIVRVYSETLPAHLSKHGNNLV